MQKAEGSGACAAIQVNAAQGMLAFQVTVQKAWKMQLSRIDPHVLHSGMHMGARVPYDCAGEAPGKG